MDTNQLDKKSESDKEDTHGQDWRVNLPSPIPSLGMFAYEEEKRLALLHSPERQANYERYLNASRREATANYLPVKLDIENVSRCNFRCTMCQVSEWTNLKRAEDMPFEAFKHLIDHEYGLVEIKLQGMGEPTLGGQTYFDMIRYAREQHIWVRTVTNASMLHLRDIYKKLVDSGANEVQISIDGATKSTFEKIRVGSNFEVVKRNCKLINDYCDTEGRHITKMWTVVQRDNLQELPALVELASELGFKHMVFSLDLTDWGQENWTSYKKTIAVDHMLSEDLADQLLSRSKELGVQLGFWSINSKYSVSSLDKLCPWPFERSYVSSDMRIVPCCMIANPDVSDLGDAMNFTEQWNGQAYQEFRQAHLDGQIPKICRACYEWRTTKQETLVELKQVD